MSDVEIRVRCGCGAVLAVTKRETDSISNLLTITVEPCLDCMEEERSEGYSEGYSECEDDYR